MVTAFPYYPSWQKVPGDQGRLYRTENFDGVTVHRCWHYVPRKATTLRRILHELSFAITAFVRLLFLARPDLYIVVSPPLVLGPLASLIAWLKRRPYAFHVQDLQPDAALGLGMVQPGAFTRLLFALESWAYRDAALVSGISEGMTAAFSRKGVPEAKRFLFSNWIRWFGRNAQYQSLGPEREAAGRAFREKFGITERSFLASYSGNLGRKQGLETLIAAAEILGRHASGDALRGLTILLVGDGVMRQALQAQVDSLGLNRQIRMLPLLSDRDYRGMLVSSDICLVTQAPGTGQHFFPSKLLSVLSVGTPVLSVADEDSELARAVEEGQFGVNVPPGNPTALAEQLRQLAENPVLLDAMRAHTAWVQRFSAAKVLGAFEQKLVEISERNLQG
jgi:colanic acid biosynthesis glycosyl transferase WcaI